MIKFIYTEETIKKYGDTINFTSQNIRAWNDFRRKYSNLKLPQSLTELVTASTFDLASIYIQTIKNKKFQEDAKKLTFLSYDNYSNQINNFFIENRDNLHISTCLYCNMTYVNIFESKEADLLYLLNEAPENELKAILEIIEPDITKRKFNNFIKIIRTNKKSNLKEYLTVDRIKTRINKIISYRIRQQFDLDHFLPKSDYILISLSLNNFIPSCQICNSRLKLRKNVYHNGMQINDLEKLFPTSPNYNFSDEIKFSIEVLDGVKPTSFVKSISDCNLVLKSEPEDSLYKNEALLFRIQERYNYHIIEPLSYLDKLSHFTKSYFKMLQKNTGFTNNEISLLEEAIFDRVLRTDNNRIFKKLYDDISL